MKKQIFSYNKPQQDKSEVFIKPSKQSIKESKEIIKRLKAEIEKKHTKEVIRNVLRRSVGQ